MKKRSYIMQINKEEMKEYSEYFRNMKDSEMEPNKHLASSIRHFLILAEIEFKGVTDTKDAIDDLDYSDLF